MIIRNPWSSFLCLSSQSIIGRPSTIDHRKSDQSGADKCHMMISQIPIITPKAFIKLLYPFHF